MSIADYPAGQLPAGYDATVVTARVIQQIGSAPQFDPYNRQYVLTADLGVAQDDPIWHRVSHLLGIALGELASTPDDGFDVESIRRSTKVTALRAATDAVQRALKPLLDNGDVEIVKVTVITTPRWLGQIFTDLRNLRQLNAKPVRFKTAGVA